jgi:hypothetical protein
MTVGHRVRSRPGIIGRGGRVVVVSASIVGGHDGIARELACRLRADGRTVDLVDAVDLHPGRLGHLLRGLYRLQLTVAPRNWSWLLAALDTRPLTALARGFSRLAVQNAGGLTAAEALASGVPVVTYRCLPGHGRTNAAALDAEGLVPWIQSRAGLAQGLTCAGAAGTAVWACPGRADVDAALVTVLPAPLTVESRTAC